jgi:hypothetical protein
MDAAFLEVFCLRLAMGMLVALLFLSPEQINPRFHRIQSVIVLGLATVAVVLSWSRAESQYFLGVGVAIGACILGSVFWTVHAGLAASGSVILGSLGLLTALTALHGTGESAGESSILSLVAMAANDCASAAVLGLATTAMLVGHWYLIAPTMAIDPLLRLILALAGATGLRILTALADVGSIFIGGTSLDALGWLWLLLRWGIGFVGLGVLTFLAWQTARIRSTQSATGILYVVTIFAFFGELTAQLLHAHLAAAVGLR